MRLIFISTPMRLIWLFLLLIGSHNSYSQHYQYKQYKVEDGLPTDIIKSIAQDSLGYFWIATDEGLVRYDGVHFITYRKALHNQYAKGLITTQNKKLLLFGDLDLIEIDHRQDTALFKTVRLGTRNQNDSMLWYPKAFYEDKQHTFWLSEPQSVTRLKGNHLERYPFGINDRSAQFLRSFTFFEDLKGNLYTSSYFGNVYRFDPNQNKFIAVTEKFPPLLSHIIIADEQLWIGSDSGLYTADLKENGGFEAPVLKYPIKNVSYVLPLPDNRLFVCTRDDTHFFVGVTNPSQEALPFSINNINHAYLSKENDLWLSSNEGIFLIQKNTILTDPSTLNNFIEAITEDPSRNRVFYITVTDLFTVQIENGKTISKKVLSLPNGYFQSLKYANNGFWSSNNTALIFIQENKIHQQFLPDRKNAHFMPDIFLDSKKRVWASQSSNQYAFVVDSTFKVTRFFVPISKENNINLFREGPNGMYAASTGKSNYLFYKSSSDTAFHNISLPVHFETSGDFNVTDIAFSDSIVWLATTEGLIRYNYKKAQRVDLGKTFTGLPVKTVKLYHDGTLLFNNTYGMLRYSPATGEYWLFDVSNGLPSNTITTRGLFVDSKDRIWIGTSRGLAHNDTALINQHKTLPPQFVEIHVNGVPVRPSKLKSIDYNNYLTLYVSSITFPESKVNIQYRINGADTWLPVNNSVINLAGLEPGKYDIELKAKKNGDLSWSASNHFSFKVNPPFWKQSWFYLLCLSLTGFIALLSIAWANYINAKRRKQLMQLVSLRTQELKSINEELSIRNTELDRFVYSASHDLSAPLKSVLGLIMVVKMEKPDEHILKYITMMENSVNKLEAFIKDVVNYSRNTRLPVVKTSFPFTSFIQSIWSDHQFSIAQSNIHLEIQDELSGLLCSDETRLKIVFNNLISNAIKFHRPEQRQYAYVRVTAKQSATGYDFTVEDNGLGIPPALKDKIFDMFFRANDSVQGSGLGLYILKETIDKLGGSVRVESELGTGTSFIIHLPN
jgi:signal transduction histidine kinase